jgi:hypothetical protein
MQLNLNYEHQRGVLDSSSLWHFVQHTLVPLLIPLLSSVNSRRYQNIYSFSALLLLTLLQLRGRIAIYSE